jgi:hypothetical protein
MTRTLVRKVHRASLLGTAAAFACSGLVLALPAQSAAPSTADLGDGLSARAASSAVTRTKTVTRDTWFGSNGNYSAYHQQKSVTVNVDKTENLRGRQRVTVSWSGAQPSGGRAANPYGELGLNQEYPVVVMQCRGVDDPSLPVAKQVSPETCWSSSYFQRSQVQASPSTAVWTKDPFADPAALGRLSSGAESFPDATKCPTADTAGYDTALTPFKSAKGTVYYACDKDNMPPEAAVGAAFPPAEVAAFTDLAGNGNVKFEVRSDVENESLGCNHETACSIVVVPIMGVSCSLPTTTTPDNADFACKKGGQFKPGEANFAGNGVDLAVSPSLWWTASNWRNRISVPITFGLPPDTCDILDPRAPTGFYGTELLAQASLQWSPAYCLSKQRFKFQHNQMSDAAGFALMMNGGGPAAEVSSEHDNAGGDPVAYAPTAITGFGIGYVIDKPDNAGEFDDLKLNARLLAKLLTQSYLGSDLGRGHPGMGTNPVSINVDPEFKALNPGLSLTDQEAAATVLSLSESSDVIEQLTDYIAHDQAAMDFIGGKPDPWGMKINPSYQDIAVPTPEWPLLDSYIPETGSTCRQANPAVYFTQLAAPVTKLNIIAQALIDSWPNVQTRCDTDVSTTPPTYKLGRVDRQNYGARFMLGVVGLGDAARYGLQTAQLQTSSGRYVGASLDSLGKAVALMKQDKPLEPFTLDQAAVKKSGSAYPGAMVVYTAARTQHLDQADAEKVAQFIRISTSEGQQPGSGNGELPDGFLPIKDSGVTQKLWVSAQEGARAISAQFVPATPTPTPTPTATPTSTPTQDPGDTTLPGSEPSAAPSVPVATSSGPAPITDEVPVPVAATAAVTSQLGNWLLPALLGLGILGGLIASATRLALAIRA